MRCQECNQEDSRGKYKFVAGKGFLCYDCYSGDYISSPSVFKVVDTVNLPHYHFNNGNVSVARIAMIKSRRLAPHGNGEVVLTRNGKITDKLSINY